MTKLEARSIFGSYKDLAVALKMTPQGFQNWPENLKPEQIQSIIGAAIMHNKPLPIDYQWAVKNYADSMQIRKL